MHFVSIIRYALLTTLLIAGLPAVIKAQSILIDAEARPSVLMAGETSTYSIRFLNTTSIPNLNTPRVEGLEFSSTPTTSTNRQYINGRSSVEVALSWGFRATRMGDFTIPGRTVKIRGEEIRIPDVRIRVTPMSEEMKTRAMLLLKMPDPPYYVGQALPSRITYLLRDDYRLVDFSEFRVEDEAFMHSEIPRNPLRGSTEVNGRLYNGNAWDIVITPIKSGPAELSFAKDILIEEISSNRGFPSSFLLRGTKREQVTLSTDSLSTEILPLPTEDKPDSFKDAIGQFEISTEISSSELKVGEPLTLTLTLKGQGNFDRISPPELPEWDNWRQYPPKVAFTPENPNGYSGSKTFEYILIPQDTSVTEVPGMSFTYFSPDKATYVTASLDAVPVQVEASDKPVDDSPFGLLKKNDEAELSQVPEAILPLRPEFGVLQPKGTPFWIHREFLLVNLLTALVLLITTIWQYRRRRLENDSQLARRHSGSRKVRKALQRAQSAAKANNADDFFSAARFAIQESICHFSRKSLEAKTLVTSDCLDILRSNSVPDALLSKTGHFLDAADAHQFAGVSPSNEAILQLHQDLVSVINKLNRRNK